MCGKIIKKRGAWQRMDSICRFIPAKSGGDLKTVHFVLETEFKKMRQPFIYPIYYMFLVTRGEGKLRVLGRSFDISQGSLYFAFPGVPYEIDGSDDLTYMYISYMGLRAADLMSQTGASPTSPVIQGFDVQIPFWKSSIQRITQKNANVLTESVLLYTLSYLSGNDDEVCLKSNNLIENITSYIDNNYGDPDLSLKKIADIFAYTDKYLSHVFKENTSMNFSEYLTRLRVKRALELIGEGERDIQKIALESGYRDSVYFAKVFKRYLHKTPNEYIKAQQSK